MPPLELPLLTTLLDDQWTKAPVGSVLFCVGFLEVDAVVIDLPIGPPL